MEHEMVATEETRSDLEKEVASLKREIAKINKSLAAKATEVLDDADDVFENAKGRATDAARQLRQQAGTVSEAIRENPGTAATVLSSSGLLGFVLGVAVAGLFATNNRGRW